MNSLAPIAAFLLGLTPAAALAAPAQTTAPKPKLVVAISVDQFSADLFAEYRPLFSAGLKRLSQGVVFPSGYQSHGATETCPGHSTILTGSRPARTGIVANTWFDLGAARPDKAIYCAEDESVAGSSSDNYTVSPAHLKVPTLGDRMKAANPASRVVAVAGKDRAAVMMGGHATDQIWFWGSREFVTLPGRPAPVPQAVARVNARIPTLLGTPPRAVLPAACAGRSLAVPVGDGTVGTLVDREAGDVRAFRASADFDAAIADVAIGLIGELKLGRGPAPDLLAIGLSATDYVGHGYGTRGAEMCAQMIALDATIGRILAALDASGSPYVVTLTADHGGHDLAQRERERSFPQVEPIDPALLPGAIGFELAAEVGALPGVESLVYADSSFGDWYLSRALPADRRAQVLAKLRAILLAHAQVAAVLTKDELARMPAPTPPVEEWSLAERARASFDPDRSGDLYVILKPNVMPIANPQPGYVLAHGSPYMADRRVPILFWWNGIAGYEQPRSVETVDILPTLAGLLDLPVPPAEIDGRCLDLDRGPASTCAD